jgi:hypothetical protein
LAACRSGGSQQEHHHELSLGCGVAPGYVKSFSVMKATPDAACRRCWCDSGLAPGRGDYASVTPAPEDRQQIVVPAPWILSAWPLAVTLSGSPATALLSPLAGLRAEAPPRADAVGPAERLTVSSRGTRSDDCEGTHGSYYGPLAFGVQREPEKLPRGRIKPHLRLDPGVPWQYSSRCA